MINLLKARWHDATKTCEMRRATVEYCHKKVEWFQLSCNSIQQWRVAQISPLTERDFVARHMSHVFVASSKCALKPVATQKGFTCNVHTIAFLFHRTIQIPTSVHNDPCMNRKSLKPSRSVFKKTWRGQNGYFEDG